MDLLLLGGNSAHNKDWINSVSKTLVKSFNKRLTHSYIHWGAGEGNIDIKEELKNISAEISNFNEYVVFAKSVGTIVAARGVYENILHPQKCIFVGLPMLMINKDKSTISTYLKSIKKPILFIQNNNDPFGSIDEVKVYLKSLNLHDSTVIESDGDTHNYNELNKLNEEISKFLDSK